jgi:hypothetical protein
MILYHTMRKLFLQHDTGEYRIFSWCGNAPENDSAKKKTGKNNIFVSIAKG